MRQREREAERVREIGIGALSSDREGGRVQGGGVEPERKSCAEEDFVHYQKTYQLNSGMQLIIPH